MIASHLIDLLLMSCITGVVTYNVVWIVHTGELFKGLLEKMHSSDNESFINDMVTCPVCFSYWVSAWSAIMGLCCMPLGIWPITCDFIVLWLLTQTVASKLNINGWSIIEGKKKDSMFK